MTVTYTHSCFIVVVIISVMNNSVSREQHTEKSVAVCVAKVSQM